MAAPEQAEIRYPDSLPLALLAFHRTVGPIYKSSSAKYGLFADLRTVLEAVMPPLLEQGLVLSQTLSTNANGCTSLTTTLTHAPSNQQISSEWVLPSLDQLLARVHELRTTAIDRFPLDLQLAAVGALPPVLPPRPDATAAAATATAVEAESGGRPALPPPPPRSPGLRLDDQLKGLYTLLGQVGTTTNPLHSMGGAITYCRRYQILSLLCLAAEDNDGNDASPRETSERSAPRAPSPNGIGTGAGTGNGSSPAPRPAATRSKRRPALDPPAAPPQAQGQAQGQAQAHGQAPAAVAAAAPPVAAPANGAAPSAATPAVATTPHAEPSAPPSTTAGSTTATDDSALLTLEQVQNLIGSIRHLPPEGIASVAAGFRERFGIPEKQMVSDYIKTTEHAAFITSMCRQYTDAHQANIVPV